MMQFVSTWIARWCLATAFAAAVFAASAACVLARPCFVSVMIVPTADSDVAAVRFSSIVDGSGDVSLVADSATQRYTVTYHGLPFEVRTPAAYKGGPERFSTAPLLVRLPAKELRDATVTLIDSNSDKPLDCTPQRDDFEQKHPTTTSSPPPWASPATGSVAKPTVAAAPPAECQQPYTPVKLERAAHADYPEMAIRERATGRVNIAVEVDSGGKVLSAGVYSSSGWKSLDESAMNAAASSKYKPEVFRCAAVGGVYLFTADFRGQ